MPALSVDAHHPPRHPRRRAAAFSSFLLRAPVAAARARATVGGGVGVAAAALLVLIDDSQKRRPRYIITTMVRGERRPVAGGLVVGPWLLIAVLVYSSFLGSTVDAARTSPFVVTTAAPLRPTMMAPAPSPADALLGESKRKVPTGSNPLHNR